MSITESPKFGQPRVPEGTFVVFSFDPPAYAAALDPEDGILATAASGIKRKKYLGLIEGVGPVDLPRLRQNPDIRVVGQAPPQEGEDDVYFTNPKRCIPVHPCVDHPEGRAPLVPSAPLPWPDCYVHTLQLVNAFVSRVHHSTPKNAKITPEELRRVSDLVVDDQYGAAADRRAARAGNERRGETYSELSYYSDDSEDEDGGDSSASSFGDEISAPAEVYIEIWEDLTVATSLGEPKDVGADIDEIVQIGEEWANRKKLERRANAAETSKWAEQVAESGHAETAGHDQLPIVDVQLHGHEAADELSPEDAIDERADRSAYKQPMHSSALSNSFLDPHRNGESAGRGNSIHAVGKPASVAISHGAPEEVQGVDEDRRSETIEASHAHLVHEEELTETRATSKLRALKGWFQQILPDVVEEDHIEAKEPRPNERLSARVFVENDGRRAVVTQKRQVAREMHKLECVDGGARPQLVALQHNMVELGAANTVPWVAAVNGLEWSVLVYAPHEPRRVSQNRNSVPAAHVGGKPEHTMGKHSSSDVLEQPSASTGRQSRAQKVRLVKAVEDAQQHFNRKTSSVVEMWAGHHTRRTSAGEANARARGTKQRKEEMADAEPEPVPIPKLCPSGVSFFVLLLPRPCLQPRPMASELSLYVLDNLGQPDVIRAARVSRRWRSVAVIHRYYYASIVFWSPTSAPWSLDTDFTVSKFCQTLRWCKLRGVRLCLDLDIERDAGRWIWDYDIQRDYGWLDVGSLHDPFVECVLPALADVLSQVVKLRLKAHPEHHYPDYVYASLRGAAPLLGHFELDLSDESGRYGMHAPPPPLDLFASNAPQLRTVKLWDIELPDMPIPALLPVDDVDLQFIFQPPLSLITACFPRSRSLLMRCGNDTLILESPAPAATFSPTLQRLKLHLSLYDEFPPDIRAALKTERIPHVELGFCSEGPDIFSLIDHLPEYLSLALRPDPEDHPDNDGRMELAPAEQSSSNPLTRAFAFSDYDFEDPLLAQLSLLNHRLVRIEIAHKFLARAVLSMRSLPELKTLTIDITDMLGDFWHPEYMYYPRRVIPVFQDASSNRESSSAVLPLEAVYQGSEEWTLDCPKLTRLALHDGGASSVIETRELLHLARDLSLLRSDSDPLVTLELEGVSVAGPRYVGLLSMFTNYQ
ncbi:hypothetical protein AURDEDRAFT_153894 [Auricularia subglabra TFB-10046 SS5]|nr:hypothetical protein AURDEDRAFT_153894 [Auricularia subglabra TFB-10046 SS5]